MNNLLLEKTRSQLITKSKDADVTKSYGTTRYERRHHQHIYSALNVLNKIDMNALFKGNLLSFFIPIQGETNNYEVEVLFDSILNAINRELRKNSWLLEYKVVYRALVDAINKQDIYVSCTCPDWKYRMAYWGTKGRYNSGHPQIVPAKVTNPNDTKGAGCKHVLKVLADLDWALKLASCIYNYIVYMEENYPDKYFNVIFPAIYGESYDDALSDGLIEPPEDELIDVDEVPEPEEEDRIEISDDDFEEEPTEENEEEIE